MWIQVLDESYESGAEQFVMVNLEDCRKITIFTPKPSDPNSGKAQVSIVASDGSLYTLPGWFPSLTDAKAFVSSFAPWFTPAESETVE